MDFSGTHLPLTCVFVRRTVGPVTAFSWFGSSGRVRPVLPPRTTSEDLPKNTSAVSHNKLRWLAVGRFPGLCCSCASWNPKRRSCCLCAAGMRRKSRLLSRLPKGRRSANDSCDSKAASSSTPEDVFGASNSRGHRVRILAAFSSAIAHRTR